MVERISGLNDSVHLLDARHRRADDLPARLPPDAQILVCMHVRVIRRKRKLLGIPYHLLHEIFHGNEGHKVVRAENGNSVALPQNDVSRLRTALRRFGACLTVRVPDENFLCVGVRLASLFHVVGAKRDRCGKLLIEKRTESSGGNLFIFRRIVPTDHGVFPKVKGNGFRRRIGVAFHRCVLSSPAGREQTSQQKNTGQKPEPCSFLFHKITPPLRSFP